MAKVTDVLASNSVQTTFICDFSPPRGARPELLDGARLMEADFICVAYNPGKAVRVDSIAAAYEVKRATGREVVFNLSPRDMNRLAIESRLLGAQLLGLQNVVVIQGDRFSEKDGLTPAGDYTATALIADIRELNSGLDFRGGKLRDSCDFCVGAAVDLSKGVRQEARLARRKLEAGAQFFLTQPVFNPEQVADFFSSYEAVAGVVLAQPVFWGLQIPVQGGILFNFPEDLRRDLEGGRDGVDIALETYALLREVGVTAIYLVAPILRGGARDYEAAGRFLSEVEPLNRA